MTLKTQIRRTMISTAALSVFGTVAAVGAERVQPAPGVSLMASCDDVQVQVIEPVLARGDAATRTEWRALMPAMIFRTRN